MLADNAAWFIPTSRSQRSEVSMKNWKIRPFWRRKTRLLGINPLQVDKARPWKWGTRYVDGPTAWRYACAGEKLDKGILVEPGLAARILLEPGKFPEEGMADIIYGDVRAIRTKVVKGHIVLGWPEVEVPGEANFWLREPPPGTKFVKEAPDGRPQG